MKVLLVSVTLMMLGMWTLVNREASFPNVVGGDPNSDFEEDCTLWCSSKCYEEGQDCWACSADSWAQNVIPDEDPSTRIKEVTHDCGNRQNGKCSGPVEVGSCINLMNSSWHCTSIQRADAQ